MPLIPRPPFWKQKVTAAPATDNPSVDDVADSLTRNLTDSQTPDTVRDSLVGWATQKKPPTETTPPRKPFFLHRQIEHCEQHTWTDLIPAYYCINKALTEVYPEERLRRMGQGVVGKQRKLLALIREQFSVQAIPNMIRSEDARWNDDTIAMVPTVDYQQIVDFVKIQEHSL